MGRFSSVQAYADHNSSAVSYEQAVGTAAGKDKESIGGSTINNKGGVKTEKVVNPYSSTAGAGSGDFHLYRHARARELQRIEALTKEQIEQQKDEEFKQQRQKEELEAEARTAKRRQKRQKAKEVKSRKKNLAKLGIISSTSSSNTGDQKIYSVQADEDDDDDNESESNNLTPTFPAQATTVKIALKNDTSNDNSIAEDETKIHFVDNSFSESNKRNLEENSSNDVESHPNKKIK